MRRPAWRPSLQAYLVGMMCLFVVAAVTALYLQREHNIEQSEEALNQRMELLASIASRDISEAIDLTQGTVAGLAANPGLSELFELELGADSGCTLTFTGAGPFPEGHIDIVDEDGNVRCSSAELPRPGVHAGAAWLDVDAEGPSVHHPVNDPTSTDPQLVVTAPIPGQGVVATFLDLSAVDERLASTLSGSTPVAFSLIDAEDAGPTGSTGDIQALVPVPSLDQSVRAAIDRDDALRDARRLNGQLLLYLVVALVGLSAVTFLVYRGLARPIERLSATVRQAMAGGTPHTVEVSGPAEVASLGRDFVTLVGQVDSELSRRREAEDEARRSEESYRMLFEANPQPMWVHDSTTRHLLQVNRAMVSLTGLGQDELIGLPFDQLLADDRSDQLVEALDGSGLIERSGPWQLNGHDGEPLQCEISSNVLTTGARSARLVVAEDVTAQLRTQSLLQRAQRMESLGQLAGGIAHDFNNVLAVMLNYADFAAETLADAAEDDPAQWAEALRDIEQVGEAGRRAAELTHRLLSFARGESTDTDSLNLNEVVSGIEPMLRRTIGEQIDLRTALEPELWRVEVNAGQIEQVIVNLAVNARDAMPGGGELLIETGNVDVDEDYVESRPDIVPGRHVRLRVSDTGVGMDEQARDHAFEPFFTTKPLGSGTGLGLATVYGVVTRAGGSVHVYSEPGMGTSISILLPVTRAEPTEVAAAIASPAHAPGHEIVLLVEDDADLRAVAERILLRGGYQVLSAADGAAALDLADASTEPIDLLLSDMVMPEMPGTELARRMLELRPSTRILFMSGYAPPVLVSRGNLPVEAPIIDKPFSADLLLRKVREILDRPAVND